MNLPFRLQLITRESVSDDVLVERARAIVQAFPHGTVAIQVRDRSRRPDAVRGLLEHMARVCNDAKAMLVVNRLVDVAAEFGAAVHLGAYEPVLMARARAAKVAWISMSAHNDNDVNVAAECGATAVMVSPVFATMSGTVTETDGSTSQKRPRGVESIERAATIANSRIMCIALGGVTAQNARDCFASGAQAVATMSQWLDQPIDKFVYEWSETLRDSR